MNKNFPTSMIVVAAVVSFGMIGSQLDLGGLSGQAAGGEAAGCGGDAYYDEDLGALVDSDGNVIDEEGESVDQGEGAERFGEFQKMAFNGSVLSQVDGQIMVSMLTADEEMSAILAEISSGEASFTASVDITNDGRFALVAHTHEDYPEVNHLRILTLAHNGWELLGELASDRGMELVIENPRLAALSDDETELGVMLNTVDAIIVDVERGEYQFATPMALAELRERAELSEEEAQLKGWGDVFTAQSREFVSRTYLSWASELTQAIYGEEVDYGQVSSLNNEMMLVVNNDVYLVNACNGGEQPVMRGNGALTCGACVADNCSNLFNRVDMLELSELPLDERLEALGPVLEEVEAVRTQRVAGAELAANLFEGYEKGADSDADNARRVYVFSDAGRGNGATHDGWTVNKSGNMYMIYKGCTFVWKGSDFDDSGADWWHNLSGSSVSFKGENVRKGFRDHFNLTSSSVKTKIKNCSNPKFIGHSLGGAAAMMAYEYSGEKGSVATFGAPGAYKNSSSCNRDGTRYVRDGDPVPSLASNHRVDNHKGFDHNCVERNWYGTCKRRGWEKESLSCNEGGGVDWDFWNSLSKHSMNDSYKAGVKTLW